MNHERAEMRAILAELQAREKRLMLRLEEQCSSLRKLLNTALTPVEELNIPRAGKEWDDLEAAWIELQGVRAQIARLHQELD